MKDYSQENSMVCNGEYEDRSETKEQDPDEYREMNREELHQDLTDALRDITLSQQIDRIEALTEKLGKNLYCRRQAE